MTLGASTSAHPRLLHAARDLMGVLLAILVVIAGSFVGIAPAIATPSTPSTSTYDGSGGVSRAQAPAGLSERIASSFREGDSRAGGTSAVRGAFGVAANTEAAAANALPKLGVRPNFGNPAEAPGEGWVWRGTGDVGSSKGSWYNPATKESLHPDLAHPEPIGPHYDWKAPDGITYRVYPDGTVVPK